MIDAPIENCFDLSRSIDLHVQSMSSSKEQAIAGKTYGYIELNEAVTWKAKHFGFTFQMTNEITKLNKPIEFIDEMIKGPFKKLKHIHQFRSVNYQTEMTDIFIYCSPFGIFGYLAEKLFLNNYMKKLLMKRNAVIKTQVEKKPETSFRL
ncbi:SRPBCC family protein [Pedobacter sp. HCMS5-2]|uniref:SRPBCC family protein n=2 Tax=Pedobacter punctiformis TaxID=3004097 RepID=A0ABT4L4U8_9SPHI|nr:SRPBCC family protein [Pedobacter sp. HCMS5-2]